MINFQYDQDVEYQAIREEERAEGERKKAIEMAKKLLFDNMSFEMIKKYTRLELEDIESIVEEKIDD